MTTSNSKISIEKNIDSFQIGSEQARYFSIQIFSGMKKYIEEHKAEFEEWLLNEETNKTVEICGKEV